MVHIYRFPCIFQNDVVVTSKTFNPNGTGTVVWDALMENGYFEEKLDDAIRKYAIILLNVFPFHSYQLDFKVDFIFVSFSPANTSEKGTEYSEMRYCFWQIIFVDSQ